MRRRRAPVLALATAAVVLAACGAVTPPARSLSPPARGGSPATTAPGNGGAPRQEGASTASGGGGAPGAAAGSSAGAGGTPSGSEAAGPVPAQAGSYRYAQSGSFQAGVSTQSVPAQGTVVVDPPTAVSPGDWTQVWHSYVDPSQPPSDTTFAIAPAGVAITAEVIRMAGITFSCTFSPPLEVIAWPPAVGHEFSGTGNCGSFTAAVSGSVTGTQPTSVDGASVTAYVVQTHVTTTGSLSSSSTETDWFDAALGLDLYQDTSQSGTYDGIGFSSKVTRKILSGHPG